MVSNIFAPNTRMKDTGDQPAVEFDLQSYKFEDDDELRQEKKTKRLGMLKSHVANQGGSPEMAYTPLMSEKGQYECKASYWWFTMHQVLSSKTEIEYYPYETMRWENYSIEWSHHLQKAVGANGDLSKEGVKEIFNRNIRQVTEQMLKEAQAKMRVIRANWKEKYPPAKGRIVQHSALSRRSSAMPLPCLKPPPTQAFPRTKSSLYFRQ